MDSVRDKMKQTQDRQQLAAADPVTVVALARQSLYEIPSNQRDTPTFWALEEVISRFDQASRAHLGGSAGIYTGMTTGQQQS